MQKKRGKYKRKWALEIEIKKIKKKKKKKKIVKKLKYIYRGIKRVVIVFTH